MEIIIIYIILINIFAILLMYSDKKKARKHSWRISEGKLFLTAIILGSPGIWFGMYFFKHKTKHYKFILGIPTIITLQIMIYFFLISKFC